MTAVPTDVSRAVLEKEVTDAAPWAERHSWELKLVPDQLVLDVRMRHPADEGPLLLRGEFVGYRAVPPLWLFLDSQTLSVTPHAWPSRGAGGNPSSILHSVGIICAHFSRRAYAAESGPHDWGGLANWAQVHEGVHAETVGEMLAAIDAHLRYSPGRMG